MNLKVFIYTLFLVCFASSINATGNTSKTEASTGSSAMTALNHVFSADVMGDAEKAITSAVIPFKKRQDERTIARFRLPSLTTQLASSETGISRGFHLIASIGSVREANHRITLPYYYLFLFRLTPF